MGELALAAEIGYLAGEQAPDARAQFTLAEVLPTAAEKGQRQLAVAVSHDCLEDRAGPVVHLPDGRAGHLGLDRNVIALPQPGQVRELAALVVPARVVAEQVAASAQADHRRQPL